MAGAYVVVEEDYGEEGACEVEGPVIALVLRIRVSGDVWEVYSGFEGGNIPCK